MEPVRFSIRKALGIFAVFTICFAIQGKLDGRGIVLATVTALALSGLILLANRKNSMYILLVLVGALTGAVFGLSPLASYILDVFYGYPRGLVEVAEVRNIGVWIGATCGSLIAVWLNHTNLFAVRPDKSEQ